LAAVVGDLPALLPDVASTGDNGKELAATVADLARGGALQVLGPIRVRTADSVESVADVPVLEAGDVIEGRAPTAPGNSGLGSAITLAPGDVVVPVVARRLVARVITDEAAVLGANLYLLRPNQAALDPWFLAGQLRSATNEKQASSLSGSLRFDVRRARIRRLPLAEQRAHGETYRQLAAFDDAIQQAATLGAELVRLVGNGLSQGTLAPKDAASS
jgi:hypothetical protein